MIATAGVRAATETVAQRIADMVRDAPDAALPIPRSDWTVGDAAAHLAFTTLGLAMMARGLAIPYGDGTRAGLAEANELALDGFSERDTAVLADELLDHTRMVFDEAAVQPPDRICPTPMGELGIDGLCAYVLTHQAMHGSAISTALRRPWPFEPGHIEHMWPFLAHVLPKVALPEAARGLTACIQIDFGTGFSFALNFDDGRLTASREPAGPVDCRISGDAQELFVVLVKIITPEEAVEAGDMILEGPRAQLGLVLPDLFDIP